MKAGIYAPVPHVVPYVSELADITAESAQPLPNGVRDHGYELARRYVLDAEAHGFDIALIAERHIGQDLEAWMLAAALAGQTSRIRLMPALNPDFWNPALVAKMSASLDRIAPGRSAINFVTGWNKQEHEAFSATRHADEDAKYRRAEEFLATWRALALGDSVTQDGFFPLSDVSLPLIPASGPPPIYAVSRSERGLDMVARGADVWFVGYPLERSTPFEVVCQALENGVEDMRRRADKYQREVRFGISAFVLPDSDEKAANERADRLITEHPHWMSSVQWAGLSAGLVGGPEQIQERLDVLAGLGLELVLCRYVPVDGELDAIAEAVRPILL